jgi:hypothetical protein
LYGQVPPLSMVVNKEQPTKGVAQLPMKLKDKKNLVKEIRPHAGPQTDFLASSADIVIYGGSAGGG